VDQYAPVPELFSLRQNYPNPFNPVTNIEFELPVTTDVRLTIYNFVGQEINTLVNERTAPGTYRVTWNGLNSHGQQVSTGVYFYRLETDRFMDTKKMVIIK
jgi:flagellar hook assembly protein FlgD